MVSESLEISYNLQLFITLPILYLEIKVTKIPLKVSYKDILKE